METTRKITAAANNSMDVKAKQQLSFNGSSELAANLQPISPHVISSVGHLRIINGGRLMPQKYNQMRKFLSLQNPSSLSLLVLLLFVISCANLKDRENLNSTSSTPANSTLSLANSNSSANQNASTSTMPSFATNIICSLPKQVAPNTPFANLGGGSWGKWGDSDGELDFGCNGGKDSVKIVASDNGDITAEYGAIGGAQTVHYVSAEYMAMQYTGLTPDEKKFRQQYVDFCDKLSLKFYGVKMPDKFRKRLLDESTYSASGTANEYAEKVGSGYVNLSSNNSSDSF